MHGNLTYMSELQASPLFMIHYDLIIGLSLNFLFISSLDFEMLPILSTRSNHGTGSDSRGGDSNNVEASKPDDVSRVFRGKYSLFCL